MRDPRLTKLADVLVNYSVNVRPGQIVRLSGPQLATPLITELFRATLKAGGNPLVRLTVDELADIMLREASDDQLKFLFPLALPEVETIDATISMWAESNTKSMTNVDPRKLSLLSTARKPVSQTFLKRAAEGKLRWCGTQYPTQASAQDAEMSLEEYEDFVFSAGLLHLPDPVAAWRAIAERQQRLTDFLNGKKDYRVVAANGTDIRMSVAGRTWINCCGKENFPDGEVFTGPVLDSVEGVVQFSFPAVHMGREVQDARLVFRSGKVVEATATKGEDFLIQMLDMDAGARFLGECAIGTNYAIKRYTKNTLFDEKIGGTVHFAVGAGYPETGNTNASGLHWDMVVDLRQGGTIEVDGQVLNENGTFKDPTFPN
jgi:aminopeptidase